MASSIPISQVVTVTPSALSAAGGVAFINGLILTHSVSVVPAGTVESYSDATDVGTAFGTSSIEYQMAEIYFSGYTGATQTPSTLYFGGVTDPSAGTAYSVQLATLYGVNQEWAGIATTIEPTLTEKQDIATWVSEQGDRFWYAANDTDTQATTNDSTTAFGVWLQNQDIDGTTAIYGGPLYAAAALSWMASLDFDSTNGRSGLFARRFSGLTAAVSTGSEASILIANGYTFYGLHSNGLGRFTFFRGGQVSGQFLWADSYINQIWMNASFQYDLLNMLLTNGNIPYNTQGDAIISASLQDTINQAISFGAIRTGVTLTDAQKLNITNATGVSDAATTLETNGYYLYTNAAGTPAATRVKRGSPVCKFWYTDGQSIQQINLASIEVQ